MPSSFLNTLSWQPSANPPNSSAHIDTNLTKGPVYRLFQGEVTNFTFKSVGDLTYFSLFPDII